MNTNKFVSDITALKLDEAGTAMTDETEVFGNDFIIIPDLKLEDLHHAPMQLGFLVMCFCSSGSARFTLSGQTRELKQGDLLILLGEQVFQDATLSADFHATVVLMSRSYAQDCIVGLNYLWPYLIYVINHPVVSLSEEEQVWVMDCYHLLCKRLQNTGSRYLRETVIALTRAFYFEVCSLLDKRNPEHGARHNRSYAIFDEFIRIVSENFKRERSVEWYSNEMCLTPKHLSEVVKGVSGKTAGQWITTFVMIETKTLLQKTSLSIKEIAQEMNFPNQSFLGKYFKNIAGVSPSDYRHMALNGNTPTQE